MNNVFLKIIIPVFNAEQTLSRLLDSLIAQTFTDFHIIICDDKSMDSSFNIAKSYQQQYQTTISAFQLETKRFGGGARNEGFKYPINSKFTWFIDADDYLYDNNVLQNIHDFIIANPAKIYTIDTKPISYDKMLHHAPWFKIVQTEYVVPEFTENLIGSDDVAQDYKQLAIVDDSEIKHISQKCLVYTGSHNSTLGAIERLKIAYDDIPNNLSKKWQIDKKQNLKDYLLQNGIVVK